MVNRSGRASVPHGVEVIGGDATDEAFAREASEGASVVYFALNPPYNKWPELFPRLQAGVLERGGFGRCRREPEISFGSTKRGYCRVTGCRVNMPGRRLELGRHPELARSFIQRGSWKGYSVKFAPSYSLVESPLFQDRPHQI
jgi:hypothetical protein